MTGSYNPGVYTVEVRLYGHNDFDTGEFEELQVVIKDPCEVASLTASHFDT